MMSSGVSFIVGARGVEETKCRGRATEDQDRQMEPKCREEVAVLDGRMWDEEVGNEVGSSSSVSVPMCAPGAGASAGGV